MGRLTTLPLTYAETIQPGMQGWCKTEALYAAFDAGDVARGWRLGARLVSVELRGSRAVWKARERFALDDPARTLPALAELGIPQPGSWSAVWHHVAGPQFRPLPATWHSLFSWWPGGPWEQARLTGNHTGAWWRYDLVSAYRWAGDQGLPDTDDIQIRTSPRESDSGLWIVRLPWKSAVLATLPAPFQQPGATVVLSTEEIEAFQIPGLTYVRGATWQAVTRKGMVSRVCEETPDAKSTGRAYWGRWIARDGLTCFTSRTEWTLPNVFRNFIWGWLIVARVRLKCWQDAGQTAAHVYVDEVVTPHELPTGTGPGAWHEKEFYPQGITVHRTGHFCALGADVPAMQTGVPRQ